MKNNSNFLSAYNEKVKQLLNDRQEQIAMSQAVGEKFDEIGYLEFCLLKQENLTSNSTIIDVGCGSGRLAIHLVDFLDQGNYIGFDVVPELHQYAAKICGYKENFKFYTAPGLTIPEPDDSADIICFFSVMTHLLHGESFLYLKEASRVLKPNGKIIISFLDFKIRSHIKPFSV